MQDQDKKLWDRFETASKRIRDTKTGPQAESEYSVAYQNLVKAGLAGQIKKKYR